jgi:hypothetical protein
MYGYGGNDYMDGLGGNDSMYGGTGNDTMLGYTGIDWIFGQDGNDKLYGEGDKDYIYGGNGADEIKAGGGDDYVNGEAGNDKIWGELGNDTLYGGSGNDELFGGDGADLICAGDGNDTLIGIDNTTSDTLNGDGGYDSFWADQNLVWSGFWPTLVSDTIGDATAYENANSVHKVMSFANGADRTLNSDNIADPTDAGIRANFSSKPLFGSMGPHKDDIYQGAEGDCWFMATLSATAKTNPDKIRQRVVSLGDGTYAVKFYEGGSPVYYRVDGELSVSGSNLVYADKGHDESIWVAIMEKAYTHHRTGADTYDSLNGGWMSEAFADIGSSSTELWSVSNAQDLLNHMNDQLALGKAVTYAALPGAASPLVGQHAYMVQSVNYGWVFNGSFFSWQAVSVTLRNPWGTDGGGNDGSNDGYVTVSAAQAFTAFWSVHSAFV